MDSINEINVKVSFGEGKATAIHQQNVQDSGSPAPPNGGEATTTLDTSAAAPPPPQGETQGMAGEGFSGDMEGAPPPDEMSGGDFSAVSGDNSPPEMQDNSPDAGQDAPPPEEEASTSSGKTKGGKK